LQYTSFVLFVAITKLSFFFRKDYKRFKGLKEYPDKGINGGYVKYLENYKLFQNKYLWQDKENNFTRLFERRVTAGIIRFAHGMPQPRRFHIGS
jgi:hypothetical protein